MAATIDCHNHAGVELLMYLRGQFPYAQMLPDMVREGGTLGVTHWVVFPMASNLALDLAAMREGRITTSGALDRVPYSFENQRLLDELYVLFPDLADRVFVFLMFDPQRETEAQAAELRRIRGTRRFYGLKVQTTILEAPVAGMLDRGRVFLDLAEEWDIPVIVHSSVWRGDPWAQVEDVLRVAESAPVVRFCVAHSCRFDKPSLDRIAQMPNVWFDCSAHVIQCSLAASDSPHVAAPDRRFRSDYARPERVLRDLAEAYPDKMLWGSDSPYYSYVDTNVAAFSTYAAEVACLRALPTSLRTRVAHDNTLRCFRIPIPD